MYCVECGIEFEENNIYYEDNNNVYCENCFHEYVEENFDIFFDKYVYSPKEDYDQSKLDELRGK